MHRNSVLIKIQLDATVCRYLFTAKSLHVSGVTAPIIRSTKTVTAASGTGHNSGAATSLQRGLIGTIYMFMFILHSEEDLRHNSDNDDLELITPHILINTWQDLEYRLDICRATTGAHIEVYGRA